MPRLYCPMPLASGLVLELPPPVARHVQVLRLQPGESLTLFNGEGGEFAATVLRMGRNDVSVTVGPHQPVERETPRPVHLAVGMPANDRMDWLVEKAAELGVASIQPLLAQRSVLKLQGERAERKQAHWQGVAIAACEQSGRNRVPVVHPVLGVVQWLATPAAAGARLLLSLRSEAVALRLAAGSEEAVTLLSGPEGGLTMQEEEMAQAVGFRLASLGPRVLRSETAPRAAGGALTLTR
jgi:16S rRNA (uracil1498-N3)-methyltransferase